MPHPSVLELFLCVIVLR